MPEELTDENGRIVWQGNYQLWGKLNQYKLSYYLNNSNPHCLEQNLRFAGQYADNETGLHYNTFRYYDPESGHFTQQDPIGLMGGLNLYQYALNWIDPLGLKCTHSANNPKQAHAVIKDKWGYEMSPAEMRELQNTIDNIKLNRPSYTRDDIPFKNSHEMSPSSQRLDTGSGPYREWTVRTPGVGNRGERRIVVDIGAGKAYTAMTIMIPL